MTAVNEFSDARSRLYSVPLAGECGATRESIVDYAKRLSVLHNLRFVAFFAGILSPETGLLPRMGYQINEANGCRRTADAYVKALGRLTSQERLIEGTLLSWRGLLRSGVTMERHCRWCPKCLKNQPHGNPQSFSLIWSVAAIKYCPLHSIKLRTECPACGRFQNRWHESPMFGVCQHCNEDLCKEPSDEQPTEYELFCSKAVAEMIEIGVAAELLATVENYQKWFTRAVASTYCCSVRAAYSRGLCARLTKSVGTSLGSLLLNCYSVRLSPVQLLRGVSPPVNGSIEVQAIKKVRTIIKVRGSEGESRLYSILEDLLKAVDVPIKINQLAKEVGFSKSAIYSALPETSERIKTHNSIARDLRRKATAARNLAVGKQLADELRGDGERLGPTRVIAMMAARGVHWSDRAAIAAARDHW